jgi:hypothetical protein
MILFKSIGETVDGELIQIAEHFGVTAGLKQ